MFSSTIRSLHRCLLAAGASFVFAACARATELPVSADAHVNQTRNATNFGYLSNLYVGNGNTAFLQFDLSGLPSGTTSSQIAAAKVTVFVNRVITAGTVSVAAVTSTWNEGSVTYTSMPSVSGTAATTFSPTASGTYVTFDITGLVLGWITTPSTNYGIALTSSAGNLLLDSKENDQTGHAASLNVTVTSMGATGAKGDKGDPGSAGAAGPAGPTGPAGPAGAAAGGPYSSSTAYVPGSVVTYNGATYLATSSSTGLYPDSVNNLSQFNPQWIPVNGLADTRTGNINTPVENPTFPSVPYTVVSHSQTSSANKYFSLLTGGEGSSNSSFAPALFITPQCNVGVTITSVNNASTTWYLVAYKTYGNSPPPGIPSTTPDTIPTTYPVPSGQPQTVAQCTTNSSTPSCAMYFPTAAGWPMTLENRTQTAPILFTTAFSCTAANYND